MCYVDRYAARKLTADYLELCRNPAQNLPRWLAEDKKRGFGGGRQLETTTKRGATHAHSIITQPFFTESDRLGRESLHHLRHGLDAHRHGGRQTDDLLARSRARADRYEKLRPVRTEGHAPGLTAPGAPSAVSAPDRSFSGGRAALLAFYGAKIEVLRRSLPPRDVAAAVRAIRDERQAAMRAFAERRSANGIAKRAKSAAERFSARLAQQKARDGPEIGPS